MYHLIRTLRTASSERYLIQDQNQEDAAALDLHFLANGFVAGTVTLFDNGGVSEEDVPALLTWLDESLLPDVSIEDKNLAFTVVRGSVLGDYVPDEKTGAKPNL